MKNESLFDLFNASASEVKYNCRIKYKLLPDGSRLPLEAMACNRFIFNPDGVKLSELSRSIDWRIAYREASEELFLGKLPKSGGYIPAKTSEKDKLLRSLRRARGNLMDLILANDFDCFATLTLDKDKIDRHDYNAVIKRLNVYLDNRVRRSGLRYVGVPERHKDGAIHFHFLCNSEALNLVDSGTVSVPDRKKPVKVSTADRLGVPLTERHTVYNIPSWSLGFTTAIKTYGSPQAVAHYVGKYLSKGLDGSLPKKVGGRWYYSGGNLERLVYSYERISFNDFEPSYSFDCDGGSFKVKVFNDD